MTTEKPPATEREIERQRLELNFRGEPDLATLRELIRALDRSPAVTWSGKGGIKGRIEELIRSAEARGSDRALDSRLKQ